FTRTAPTVPTLAGHDFDERRPPTRPTASVPRIKPMPQTKAQHRVRPLPEAPPRAPAVPSASAAAGHIFSASPGAQALAAAAGLVLLSALFARLRARG